MPCKVSGCVLTLQSDLPWLQPSLCILLPCTRLIASLQQKKKKILHSAGKAISPNEPWFQVGPAKQEKASAPLECLQLSTIRRAVLEEDRGHGTAVSCA